MMNMEKLRLEWNDFKDNIHSTLGKLRDSNEFVDVTLACEDGERIEVHKIILASSSPFFKNLLVKNNHPHPLIYMRGVKFDHISAIVDFLYFGETNIAEEDLNDFLALATEFEMKGLSGENETQETFENVGKIRKKRTSKKSVPQTENVDQKNPLFETSAEKVKLAELDNQINSMTVTTNKINPTNNGKIFACKVCEKEGGGKDRERHIES